MKAELPIGRPSRGPLTKRWRVGDVADAPSRRQRATAATETETETTEATDATAAESGCA